MAAVSSNFVCIKAAPAHLNAGVITGKFSQYGPIDDVTIQASSHSSHSGTQTNFVIIEFECEEDARAAVEDNQNSDYTVTFYTPLEKSDVFATYVSPEPDKSSDQDVPPNYQVLPCSNSNCATEVVLLKQKIYCTKECFAEFCDMQGRINIYDKWIASMGRSGTGMLKDSSKLDKLVVTVDPEGIRSTKIVSST